MSWNQYQQAVEREFPTGSTVTARHGGGIEITVPCKHPGCIPAAVEFKMHMPPDKAKRVFVNKGWRFWGKSTTCPVHSKKKDEQMNDNKAAPITRAFAASTASDLALAAAAPVASEAARESKRLAMFLIEDKFDVKQGAYKDGYSDLKVAKEMGLAETIICDLREQFFGPIKEPREITELREQCAELAEKLETFEREFNASRDAAMVILRGLQDDLKKQNGRLLALVNRNGW